MRIIAGKNRGTKLITLEGNEITRPTLDRVKEALFSILIPYLPESKVLDLFSGSGALALEAISRGAKEAFICDNSYKAIKIIEENVKKTKNENQVTLIKKDFEIALSNLGKAKEKFDIVFLDPPYKTDYISKAIDLIIQNDLLEKTGIIVAETDESKRVISRINNEKIEITDTRKYGRVELLLIKLK